MLRSRRTPAFGAAALLAAAGACAQEAPARTSADGLPAAVVAAAEAFLRERAADLPGQPVVSVQPPSRAEQLAACDSITPFLPPGARLRPRLSVGVRCASPSAWTVYVQAAISVPGQYYVAARTIDPGQALTEDALAARSGDLITLPQGTVTDPADALGRVAGQRIAAGQPIRTRSLRSADSVQRGQTVRILARGAGFTVTGEGQAMEAGAPGASVQVRTPSGQMISAIVQDAHTVEVPL